MGILLYSLLIPLVWATVDVTAGDLNVNVSYEDLTDNTQKLNVDHKFTFTNNGNATENVTLALLEVDSQYSLSLTPTVLQLASGASQQVTLSGKVPVNMDEGTRTIGKLKVTTASGQETINTLSLGVESMLKVKKMYVYVNGQEEKTVDQSGEEVKDLKPEDKIQLRFQLQNLFDGNYDYGDIEGTIRAQLDDSYFSDEIDEEEDFTIDAGETFDSSDNEIIINFPIPLQANDGSYTLHLTIEGKDDNDARYETEWDLILKIKRTENDLRIQTFTLSPAEVSCSRRVRAAVKVVNYGSKKQNHAALSIVNSDLGVNGHYDFELGKGSSDDNSELKELWIDVNNDLPAGTYPLTATAFYDFTTEVDKNIIDLVVKDCATVAKKSETSTLAVNESKSVSSSQSVEQVVTATVSPASTSSNGAEPKSTSLEKISSSAVVSSIENPYTIEDFVLAAIIVAFVVIISLIVLAIVLLLR